MRTRIGARNKKIELQKPTKTANGVGGFTTTYATERTFYAAIWPVSAKERIQSDQRAMTVTHRVRIPFYSELRSDWKVKYSNRYSDRYFTIGGIINGDEGNREIELLCKETEKS